MHKLQVKYTKYSGTVLGYIFYENGEAKLFEN